MPIVFVHGVSTRAGEAYSNNEKGRNGFLRGIVAPALGLDPNELTIESPYWGGDGVKFRWGMAVVPDPKDLYESFGEEDENPIALRRTIDLVANSKAIAGGVAERARVDLSGTVELIFGAAVAAADSESEAHELANAYQQATAYVEATPSPPWVKTATDENFVDSLLHHALATGKASRAGGDSGAASDEEDEESFGGKPGGLLDKLREGVSRLGNALPDAGSQILVNLKRDKLNESVAQFVGDAFVYLKERGKVGEEGRIVKAVLAGINKAVAAKSAKDNKLVIVAHSFGGEIMYDILTHFRPDLEADYFITVGSQVGLFEEMKLLIASKESVPAHYPDGTVPRPGNVKRWLNVFDRNDVVSYRVGPIFDKAEDFEYDAGYSVVQAHSGYFARPSFYAQLAKRLSE